MVSGGRGTLGECGGINNPIHYVRYVFVLLYTMLGMHYSLYYLCNIYYVKYVYVSLTMLGMYFVLFTLLGKYHSLC